MATLFSRCTNTVRKAHEKENKMQPVVLSAEALKLNDKTFKRGTS